MLDIETLSTRDDAAVVAIGAAVFNEEKVIETGYWPIDMRGLTGHIDGRTVEWWLNQSKEAQQATFGNPDARVFPFLAALQFDHLAGLHNVTSVWANDPHFDFVILKNWWERSIAPIRDPERPGLSLATGIGIPWPFKYNQPRSYRTVVELAKEHGWPDAAYDAAKGMHVAHNAVEDAAAQARAVIAAVRYLSTYYDRPTDTLLHRRPTGSWSPTAPDNDWRANQVAPKC